MKHKYFSFLLAALMCVVASVANAYDAKINGIYYNFSGTTAIVTYQLISTGTPKSDYSGNVTIPKTVTYNGETYSVTSIDGKAFYGCTGLKSVTISNSVTSIGRYAFSGCSGLTSFVVENGNTKFDSRNGCNAIIETASNTLIAGCKNTIIPNSVTSIGDDAFYNCTSLTSVTIPNSVTSIGGYAFRGCTGLKSVTISNSVTSIEYSAFEYCWSLTSVTIPNSVTSIGSGAFYGCSGLTDVTIGKGLTSIGGYVFSDCTSLASVHITDLTAWCGISFGDSKGNPLYYAHHLYLNGEEVKELVFPNSVTSIGSLAFYGCTGLTSVVIPNSVTSIGGSAFHECSGLKSVVIPNSVTSIGHGAFWNCSGLTDVTIGNSVTSIGNYAFSGCTGLTSVVIPNSVTSIGGYAFRECSGLKSVVIPNSVTSIGYGAFWNCSGLTDVTIGNSVTSIDDEAFYECTGLTSVTINSNAIASKTYKSSSRLSEIFGYQVTSYTFGEGVEKIGDYACYNLSNITEMNLSKSLTSIGDWAFSNCTGLTSVTIPNSVTSIGSSAFYGCSGLTSVTIPESVTSIGNYAFYHCSGLTSIVVENGNTSYDSRNGCNAIIKTASNTLIAGCKNTIIPNSVTSIGNYAFEYCSGLTSIEIPNSVTSIGDYAFSGCTGLTSVTIPNSVTSIGNYAFNGCSGITDLTIADGEGILSLGYNSYSSSGGKGLFYDCPLEKLYLGRTLSYVTGYKSGDSPFYGNKTLTYVTIGNSVTSIGDYAFSGCSGLTSIVVENGNPTYDSRNGCNAIIETASNTLIVGCKNTIIPNNVTTIGERAFRSCTGLTSIEIPNSVTSIGSSAFRGCTGLTSIEIPNSVTEIGSYAFNDCTGLTSVIVAWATPINLLNSNTFSNASNATLYVPKGTKEAYEAARYWKNFKEIVEYEMEETGIEAIDNGQLTMDNAKGVYDLSGRRMNVNVNVNVNDNVNNSRLKKGIYIVNGKKVVK